LKKSLQKISFKNPLLKKQMQKKRKEEDKNKEQKVSKHSCDKIKETRKLKN
jgi:hypothetical protein